MLKLISNLLKRFRSPKPNCWQFERGRIEEVINIPSTKIFKIVSDDGDPQEHILLKVEDLEALATHLLNTALAAETIGDKLRYRSLISRYRNTVARQKQPIDCNRRLVVSWIQPTGEKIGWIIDFRLAVTDRLLIKRLFKKIASYQFVEESDWYLYVMVQDWVEIFKEAIHEESDIHALVPLRTNLIGKQIRARQHAVIDQKNKLYWKNEELQIGEHHPTPVLSEVSRSASFRIPYESIVEGVLEKDRLQHQPPGSHKPN